MNISKEAIINIMQENHYITKLDIAQFEIERFLINSLFHMLKNNP